MKRTVFLYVGYTWKYIETHIFFALVSVTQQLVESVKHVITLKEGSESKVMDQRLSIS